MNELLPYWSRPELLSNGLIILNVFGAMVLGIVIGYERNYHGHAAGMRTYGLVCMSSAALTVIGGFPAEWYGGANLAHGSFNADPTRVIQGVVTGIGFLGAGVIMKEGFTIRGLSTAASIWATSAIGVIVGIGFYATAIFSTLLVFIVMGSFKKLELRLPHRSQLRLTLVYPMDKARNAEDLPGLIAKYGYIVTDLSCASDRAANQFSYDLVLQGMGPHNFFQLVDILRRVDDVLDFRLSPVRD